MSWWLFGLLNWVLLGAAVGAVWAIDRLLSQRGQQAGSSRFESALHILKKRYALAEIDGRELEEKKRDLLS